MYKYLATSALCLALSVSALASFEGCDEEEVKRAIALSLGEEDPGSRHVELVPFNYRPGISLKDFVKTQLRQTTDHAAIESQLKDITALLEVVNSNKAPSLKFQTLKIVLDRMMGFFFNSPEVVRLGNRGVYELSPLENKLIMQIEKADQLVRRLTRSVKVVQPRSLSDEWEKNYVHLDGPQSYLKPANVMTWAMTVSHEREVEELMDLIAKYRSSTPEDRTNLQTIAEIQLGEMMEKGYFAWLMALDDKIDPMTPKEKDLRAKINTAKNILNQPFQESFENNNNNYVPVPGKGKEEEDDRDNYWKNYQKQAAEWEKNLENARLLVERVKAEQGHKKKKFNFFDCVDEIHKATPQLDPFIIIEAALILYKIDVLLEESKRSYASLELKWWQDKMAKDKLLTTLKANSNLDVSMSLLYSSFAMTNHNLEYRLEISQAMGYTKDQAKVKGQWWAYSLDKTKARYMALQRGKVNIPELVGIKATTQTVLSFYQFAEAHAKLDNKLYSADKMQKMTNKVSEELQKAEASLNEYINAHFEILDEGHPDNQMFGDIQNNLSLIEDAKRAEAEI